MYDADVIIRAPQWTFKNVQKEVPEFINNYYTQKKT